MIYVVKTVNSEKPFIKIGFAKKSLKKRIDGLKTSCPFDLELIMAKNGELEDERRLHDLLSQHRVNREWFNWNEEVRALLKIPKNHKPINPMSPGSFLTPRQKQINALFRAGHTYQRHVHTMELFLVRHEYTLKELHEFPVNKRRFVIFESTQNEVFKKVGSLATITDSEEDKDKLELFISAETIINWHEALKSAPPV
jgi:hypothetical protein